MFRSSSISEGDTDASDMYYGDGPPHQLELISTVEDFGGGEEECSQCAHGDMLPPPPEEAEDLVIGSLLEGGVASTVSAKRRWPGGVVKYHWQPNIGSDMKAVTEAAMAEWEAKTCIKFEEVAPGNGTVMFMHDNQDSPGCNAHVGYYSRSMTEMNLGKNCWHKGTALHEIGHTLGLGHQHQRDDSQEFVELLRGNAKLPDDDYEVNFEKPTRGVVHEGVPYDLGSIMHYGGWSFATVKNYSDDSTRTIRVKKPDSWGNCRIGQRAFLSHGDILTINRWYGCPDRYCADLDERCLALGPEMCRSFEEGAWMQQHCLKTCGLCKCEDRDQDCASLAARGQCPRGSRSRDNDMYGRGGSAWMAKNCPKSCGRCAGDDLHCKDSKSYGCGTRKKQDQCLVKKVNRNCPRMCGACPELKYCF